MQLITSRNNAKIIEAGKLSQKKYRDASSLFCFEGKKLFKEALDSGLCFKDIFVTEKVYNELEEVRSLDCVSCVSESVYEKLSFEHSPEGIFCVADKPRKKPTDKLTKIIVSSVRDPGNIGTIMRSALAFGIGEVIFSSDCADLFSPKTVRAAMGALFKQQFSISDGILPLISALKADGYTLCAAALSDRAEELTDIEINEKTCFVIGNEGHGLSDEVINACDRQVIIPIAAESESLNAAVAASVLMWEIKRNINYERR